MSYILCSGTDCGLGTEQEILATPREDFYLEMLAISMTDKITAPQDVYDRLEIDVPAMQKILQTINASLPEINHFPLHDGKSMFIGAEKDTIQKMVSGTYMEWDCLISWYKIENIKENSGSVFVTFKGIYNIEKMSEDFKSLPGVLYVNPNHFICGGSPVKVR